MKKLKIVFYFVILLFSFIIHNQCKAQISYENRENQYGLGYFFFRNEQLIFNENYITQHNIHSISVNIIYDDIALNTIYIYRRDGSLAKIKKPYPEKHSKKQQYKTFRYINSNEEKNNYINKDQMTISKRNKDFLNIPVEITQFIINDTIRKEILLIKSDSIFVDHYFTFGLPLKTEVNVSSNNSEWFYFSSGLNIFKYNFKNGLLVSIIAENRDDFQIVYNYCYH